MLPLPLDLLGDPDPDTAWDDDEDEVEDESIASTYSLRPSGCSYRNRPPLTPNGKAITEIEGMSNF